MKDNWTSQKRMVKKKMARLGRTPNVERPESVQLCGGRVLRSRRYRRPFEDKPMKRLFTPEIKRFLKGWLVRRRENPYPSREEKKELSRQTALTYVQICNWFANWRRKLKNAAEGLRGQCNGSLEDERKADGKGRRGTWGNLIRRYNSRALGNVEQFSITSDDSIWEEPEENVGVVEENRRKDVAEDWTTVEHSYSILLDKCHVDTVERKTEGPLGMSYSGGRCSEVSSVSSGTSDERPHSQIPRRRYNGANCSSSVSKWLESAYAFDERRRNSQVPLRLKWAARNVTWSTAEAKVDEPWIISSVDMDTRRENACHWSVVGRHKEEIDAAETLARLAATSLP